MNRTLYSAKEIPPSYWHITQKSTFMNL